MNRLPKEFYKKDAITLAPLLLGKIIVRKLNDNTILKYKITETECYYGEEDSACHAFKGRTKRTEVLYNEGGFSYIYLCYGIHLLLNIVTGPKDHPEAVLIRGIENYNGPGRVSKALHLTKDLNNIDLTLSDKIWLEETKEKQKYIKDKRVGINYATKKYKNIKWRFILIL